VDFDPAVGHEQRGTRRALVVSNETFHRSGMTTVCPITTRSAKYPGEVLIPAGEAGQTKDGLVLCHQLRTLDLARVTAYELQGRVQHVGSNIRREVRAALMHQLGLDLSPAADSAA
jgi:mRNA-degrading endonuclease toxin of MazEF toxin-antitoxin module